MTGPPLQRFGAAILLQGSAVEDVHYLASAGLRGRRAGGAAVPRQYLQLQAVLAAAAAEVRAAASGQHDGGPVAPQPHSAHEDNIGTAEAARILRLSNRQVQRLAADLDGRIIGGCWVFDRLAVQSYAAHRDQHRSDTAA